MIKGVIIYLLIGFTLTAFVIKSYFDSGNEARLTNYGLLPLILTTILAIIFWPILVGRAIQIAEENKKNK